MFKNPISRLRYFLHYILFDVYYKAYVEELKQKGEYDPYKAGEYAIYINKKVSEELDKICPKMPKVIDDRIAEDSFDGWYQKLEQKWKEVYENK